MLAEACAAPGTLPCACSRSAYASLARRSTPAARRTDSDRPAHHIEHHFLMRSLLCPLPKVSCWDSLSGFAPDQRCHITETDTALHSQVSVEYPFCKHSPRCTARHVLLHCGPGQDRGS